MSPATDKNDTDTEVRSRSGYDSTGTKSSSSGSGSGSGTQPPNPKQGDSNNASVLKRVSTWMSNGRREARIIYIPYPFPTDVASVNPRLRRPERSPGEILFIFFVAMVILVIVIMWILLNGSGVKSNHH